ncbi:hypothetical protein MEN41_08635 [Dolichospermum sp. ST_con]|nr:hypothetical protein [Dolichospermum sp. ST_con]MDD1420437.1 hypothetical protein [Dolichospermum sp. ST_sed1]MDD1424963.1 hypothetical protein [Dolichospermum sp. ST_sed9]MDD1433343.1 hypothetical protein [Dolichospermum sp. ST_sed6]MDD1438611.1 hypothetical protein [Dolichospermum sp. ST_sed10]MDD1442641.1 hypothetical protein [Dolichospermum sp. ST_sed3]MDD1448316.1 hypothetical protein [Dolichospermum sp. ST_sed8]MDD1453691.1 hypothetical protein [Dolichospermum sp. ST_sed7]MDD146239
METQEIIQSLPNLSINERLKIAEFALELVNQQREFLTKEKQKRQLALAAITAIEDYTGDSELNVFSDLEGEDFYEYPDKD